ncbi:aminopeptidase P family protein [Psychrilyobacter atlanticus]|uniref:aminopeptidase P family protein n=1 Tax=Psychrilyobacter atlanticus TaxID=271091 RepID=UPI00041105C9|nr:aminopeptidase P family protein [Psychrilyobacter atlanticus]
MLNDKLLKLRDEMSKNGIDAYIIPSSDAHQSEYVAEYFKGRRWISNFTGSAGTAVITSDSAGLWTDGRYFIQAEKELEGSGFDLFKMAQDGVPTYPEWLKSVLKSDSIIGFDGKVISVSAYNELKKGFDEDNFKIQHDLLESIWDDRPSFPKENIFVHDLCYAGKSVTQKIDIIRGIYHSHGADSYILSSLDDIAWTFNLRGSDVLNNTTFYAYAFIEDDKTTLFIDLDKLDEQTKSYLKENNVVLESYDEVTDILSNLKNKNIYLSPERTSIYIQSLLENNKTIHNKEITTHLKAVKNEIEIENSRECYLNDSIALLKGFKHIEENFKVTPLTELDVEDIIKNERSKIDGFKGISFDTIAGHKDHAALMHFKANEKNTYTLESCGFLLVDSGGQYLNGTTDITRTFSLGDITPEQKKDFTLVLKSVINLSRAKFLKGTTGYKLDMLARYPLWLEGIDYKCGTGHGVGFFLNIHEGPQGFSVRKSHDLPLEVGMNLTIEPGVYKEGRHGIRTENTVIVKEAFTNENGTFYEFETISFFPIDINSIDPALLNSDELEWINSYHATTFNKLSPYLNEDEVNWLRERTKQI